MIRLNNDYCHGAIPEILDALARTNDEAYAGYELDEWCDRASALIKEAAACPAADVHYIVGGTQANVAFISHALRPWESAVCADRGAGLGRKLRAGTRDRAAYGLYFVSL